MADPMSDMKLSAQNQRPRVLHLWHVPGEDEVHPLVVGAEGVDQIVGLAARQADVVASGPDPAIREPRIEDLPVARSGLLGQQAGSIRVEVAHQNRGAGFVLEQRQELVGLCLVYLLGLLELEMRGDEPVVAQRWPAQRPTS